MEQSKKNAVQNVQVTNEMSLIDVLELCGHTLVSIVPNYASRTEKNKHACINFRVKYRAGQAFELEDEDGNKTKVGVGDIVARTYWPRKNASEDVINAMRESASKGVRPVDLVIKFSTYTDKETGETLTGATYTSVSLSDSSFFVPDGKWRGFAGADCEFDKDGNIIVLD